MRRDHVTAALHRLPAAAGALKPTVDVSFPAGATENEAGDPVRVQVSSPFTFRAIMKLGTIQLTARTTMRLEQDAVAVWSRSVHTHDVSMSDSVRTRFAREHGQVALMFALLLPVVFAIGGVVIGVGNWYVHGKNLQTKVDAAAFAGGSAWSFPCASWTPTS